MKNLFSNFNRLLILTCTLMVSSFAWGNTVTLSNANIVSAGSASSSYASWTLTDGGSNTWNAYAIKNVHSKATNTQHFLQIKKYASSTAYYIQVPTLGTKITQIEMTVSGSSQPMTGGSNSATLFFSSSNSTSATGSGVVSGTGASSVTIDASSLNLNTGYITASGAVRIWDITVTYSTGAAPKYHIYVCPKDVWGDNYDGNSVSINYQKTDDSWSGVQTMTLSGFKDAGKVIYGYEMDVNPNTSLKTLQFVNHGDYYGAANWGNSADHVYRGWNGSSHAWTDLPATSNASAVYLTGSFNEWKNADDNFALTKQDGNHYTGTFVLNGASGNYEFKVYAVDQPTSWGYQFSANGFYFGDNTTATQLWTNNSNDQIVPLVTSGRFLINVEYYGNYDNHGQLTVTRANLPTASYSKGADDATGTVPSTASYAPGEQFTLPTNPFTRTGYLFTGWNDGTTTYAAGATYTMGSSNVTLTAQWQQIVYTLQSISVKTPPTKINYEVGETLDLSGLVLTATYSDNISGPGKTEEITSGYTASPEHGATLNNAGNQSVTITYNSKTTTQSITVTQYWTVSFTNHGESIVGDAYLSRKIADGQQIGTLPGVGSMTSCDATSTTFMGWTSDASFTKPHAAPSFVTASTVVKGNMDLKAVWAKEQ